MVCISMLILNKPLPAATNTQIYTSVTTARRMVVNQNIQQARQKAEEDALGIALQNAFSTLVPNQILASKLDFFFDVIVPAAKDYIITYKVLGGMENKGYYLVGVESKVDLALLEKTLTDARILNVNKNKPVVLLFISEKIPSDSTPRYWWGGNPESYYSLAEQTIVDRMTKERFMLVGNSAARPDPTFYHIKFKSIDDAKAAIELGRLMKADMIVFGRVRAQESLNRMGLQKSFNADIQLDGYNLETGKKAVTSSIEAVVKSYNNQEGIINAISKAAALSADDLIKKLDTFWIENLRKEHFFQVKISGEKFLPRYLALTRRFKQMPGIENMQPKEMGSNYGVIDMSYKGKASQFANALMLKTFDNFGFEFLEISDDLVSIELREKEPTAPAPDN